MKKTSKKLQRGPKWFKKTLETPKRLRKLIRDPMRDCIKTLEIPWRFQRLHEDLRDSMETSENFMEIRDSKDIKRLRTDSIDIEGILKLTLKGL